MSTTDLSLPSLSHEVLAQAADWFALLRSGDATTEERGQWQTWLDSAEEHRTAWRCVERISGRFEPVQNSPGCDTAVRSFSAANTRLARRRQMLLSLTALVGGGGLLGWAAWRHTPLPDTLMAWTADYRTATGELRTVALSDGTQVWLNTASAFNQDYQPDLRRLRLMAGEVLIQTAADRQRPFVVDTPQGRLRALGTRFTVRLEHDTTFVAVFEGAVAMQVADTGAAQVLQAGQQARFTRAAYSAPEPAQAVREAWTRGILIADNTPLADVVRELQRYRGGYLGVAPEVAHLPVAGSYPTNDPDRALAMLEAVLPIRVKHTLPWWVSLEARPGAASAR